MDTVGWNSEKFISSLLLFINPILFVWKIFDEEFCKESEFCLASDEGNIIEVCSNGFSEISILKIFFFGEEIFWFLDESVFILYIIF